MVLNNFPKSSSYSLPHKGGGREGKLFSTKSLVDDVGFHLDQSHREYYRNLFTISTRTTREEYNA